MLHNILSENQIEYEYEDNSVLFHPGRDFISITMPGKMRDESSAESAPIKQIKTGDCLGLELSFLAVTFSQISDVTCAVSPGQSTNRELSQQQQQPQLPSSPHHGAMGATCLW